MVLNSEAAGSNHSFGLMGEVATPPTISASSNPVMYGWQGLNYMPESGDWDNGARRYRPGVGIFGSQDPSGGLNLYTSRNNNPLRYVDLDGRDALDVELARQFVQQKTGVQFTAQLADLGDDVTAHTHFFSDSVDVSQAAYGGTLTDEQRQNLLRTLFHEAQHVSASRLGAAYDALVNGSNSPAHQAIYKQAQQCSDQYGQEFLSQQRQIRTQYEKVFQ
jgi:RHS repeat-associated protein